MKAQQSMLLTGRPVAHRRRELAANAFSYTRDAIVDRDIAACAAQQRQGLCSAPDGVTIFSINDA